MAQNYKDISQFCQDQLGEEFKASELTITAGIVRDLYGGCNSDECRTWEKMKKGYNSGFGRGIYCDVTISNGLVEKAINIRKDEEDTD